MERAKVIIIGSGPAGYTAALYASRANLAPILIEGGFVPGNQSVLPGGQLMITTEVENYPGFPEGIQGPELMERFKAQAERFGTRIIHGFVTRANLSGPPFVLDVEGEPSFDCDTLIVATGAVAKLLEIPGERQLMGYGVSACATCDAAFFRDKRVVVAGGGDSAMEESLFLTKFASSVTIVHRRDHLRASRIMADRATNHPKIRFIWNSTVAEALGRRPERPGEPGGLTGVRVKNLKSGEESIVETDGFFVAIGHKPNTELFAGQLELDELGYIKTKGGSAQTSVPGVFACGDVQDHVYRQAVTAAGTGCMAAIEAERWLESKGHHG